MCYLRKCKKQLPKERIKKLNSIGFIWKLGNELIIKLGKERNLSVWMKNYENLKAYKEKHGNCRVPGNIKEYKSLCNWTHNQRWHVILSDEKHKLLEEIGFFD